jgi:hypothetical protein
VKKAMNLAASTLRIANSQLIARPCTRAVDYSNGGLELAPDASPSWRNDKSQESLDMEVIRNKKLRGYRQYTIRKSTKVKEGYGLLVIKPIIKTGLLRVINNEGSFWRTNTDLAEEYAIEFESLAPDIPDLTPAHSVPEELLEP